MAGLCAAARARELGVQPVVYEKGTRAGGSMVLSSGFVWRYRSLELHLEQCPGADERLAATIVEQFDDALGWLESLGVELLTRQTGNPLTTGARFDPRQLVEVLSRDIRLDETTSDPTILATGGFPVRLAEEKGLMLRANPWSEGDGLDLALGRNATTAGHMDEFYGRAMPAVERIDETDFVRAMQLYGRLARVAAHDMSEEFVGEASWSETDLVQVIARWPEALAWYVVDASVLDVVVRDRTVGEMIEVAREVGAPVEDDDGRVAVLVRPGVTQTLGGIRIDERARVLREDGLPLDGLFAAGADVGGISSGGWSSGLAAALVFGRIAAETALA